MARKTAKVVMSANDRDKGKIFVLTEMSGAQVERWAFRAFLALGKSGAPVPDNIAKAGLAGLASYGLEAISSLRFEDAEPLLEEMMSCVQIQPDAAHPEVVRPLWDEDIEELATRLLLRLEVYKLHVSFSKPADLLKTLGSTSAGTNLNNTETSPQRLAS